MGAEISKFGTSSPPNVKQENNNNNSAQKNPFSKVLPAEEVKVQMTSPTSGTGSGGGIHKTFNRKPSPKA